MTDYDNRDHHNNKQTEIIKKYETITIPTKTGPQYFLSSNFSLSHDWSINRLVLKDGQQFRVITCVNIVTRIIIQELIRDYYKQNKKHQNLHVLGNELYDKIEFNEEIVKIIEISGFLLNQKTVCGKKWDEKLDLGISLTDYLKIIGIHCSEHTHLRHAAHDKQNWILTEIIENICQFNVTNILRIKIKPNLIIQEKSNEIYVYATIHSRMLKFMMGGKGIGHMEQHLYQKDGKIYQSEKFLKDKSFKEKTDNTGELIFTTTENVGYKGPYDQNYKRAGYKLFDWIIDTPMIDRETFVKQNDTALMCLEGLNYLDYGLKQGYEVINCEGNFDLRMREAESWYRYIEPTNEKIPHIEKTSYFETVTPAVINLWLDKDLIDNCDIYGPLSKGKIISKERVTFFSQQTKCTMIPMPIYTRPVFDKQFGAETNMFTKRLAINTEHRNPKLKIPVLQSVKNLCTTFFTRSFITKCKKWREEPMVISYEHIRIWLAQHPKCTSIVKKVIEYLTWAQNVTNLNQVNAHIKLESLLKDDIPSQWKDISPRIVMASQREMHTLFCSMMNEAKDRFKNGLNSDKIIYVDKLKPTELNRYLRNKNYGYYFFENDLEKQDYRTDKHMLDVEYEMDILVGVHPAVLNVLRLISEKWPIRTNKVSGQYEHMRITGGPTTAFNFMNNLQVHEKFIRENWHRLIVMAILGDDFIAVFHLPPITRGLFNYIKLYHNMICKPHLYEGVGTFISCLWYINSLNQIESGPDFIRWNRRYQVTSGVSKTSGDNIRVRKISYCLLLGPLPNVLEIIKNENLEIIPEPYYEFDSCVDACARKYKVNRQHVLDNLSELLENMTKKEYYQHIFKMWVSEEKEISTPITKEIICTDINGEEYIQRSTNDVIFSIKD